MSDITEVQELYDDLSLEEQNYVHYLYKNSDNPNLFNIDFRNLERTIFKKNKPPTPEEFLDPATGWLPRSLIDSIYDHVREDFLEILNNSDKYWCIVFYGGTRLGKSFCTRLLILYTIVYIHHLRDPALYFELAPTTRMSLYNMSFNLDKSKELLVSPLFDLINVSKKFKKTKFQDKVEEEQKLIGWDEIVYSKAADVGHITLASKLQLMSSNKSPLKILGSDIIQAYFTELTFWQEDAGANPEEIFRLLSDAIDRLKATTAGAKQPLTWVLIDSSANETDNPIEKYILDELRYQEGVFFSWKSRWEARPYVFPKWQKTGETFKVITGDGSIPAAIVYNDKQLKNIPPHLIDDVPIDAKPEYELNLLKSIKDIGGKPTSKESKFIQHISLIENLFNNRTLPNIEGILHAGAKENPRQLIWNQIRDTFFGLYNGQTYLPKRAPREPRWLGGDYSYSSKGDIVGQGCIHKEYSEKLRDVIYVVDFNFAVGAVDDEISLEALRTFATDLRNTGTMQINGYALDGFQSQETIQYCKRNNIDAVRQSVDKDQDPYLFMLSCLLSQTLKSGKNIFLKNNLTSLYRVSVKTTSGGQKKKIDHSQGKRYNNYFGDWDKSKAGSNAKDVSDALCQALFLARQDNYFPVTVYEKENNRLGELMDEIINPITIQEAFALLHKVD